MPASLRCHHEHGSQGYTAKPHEQELLEILASEGLVQSMGDNGHPEIEQNKRWAFTDEGIAKLQHCIQHQNPKPVFVIRRNAVDSDTTLFEMVSALPWGKTWSLRAV